MNLKSTPYITGDSDGIVRDQQDGNSRIEFSGFSDDIFKVIVLQNINVTANQTEDIISYQIPEHNNIVHHFLQVQNDGRYTIGNPDPTSGGRDNDHTLVGSSGNILYQAGDTVIISPARLQNTDNGVEFNVVIRRSGGAFVQANTFSFSDPLALSQLHLNNLYFHTAATDRSVSKNVDAAVILEHSGQEYIRHSSLEDFDFTMDFLGKRNIGAGSDKLTQKTPTKFNDIQAVIYRDGDGNVIDIGSGNTPVGLTEEQVQQVIRESNITELMDTPGSLGTAGQILVVNSGQILVVSDSTLWGYLRTDALSMGSRRRFDWQSTGTGVTYSIGC